MLLMEDDIEPDASYLSSEKLEFRRFSSESAPASLPYIKGEINKSILLAVIPKLTLFFNLESSSFEKSVDKSVEWSGDDSLTIFNESDSNPWNSKGGQIIFLSGLNTATF